MTLNTPKQVHLMKTPTDSIKRHYRKYCIKFLNKGTLYSVTSNFHTYDLAKKTARCVLGNNWERGLFIE